MGSDSRCRRSGASGKGRTKCGRIDFILLPRPNGASRSASDAVRRHLRAPPWSGSSVEERKPLAGDKFDDERATALAILGQSDAAIAALERAFAAGRTAGGGTWFESPHSPRFETIRAFERSPPRNEPSERAAQGTRADAARWNGSAAHDVGIDSPPLLENGVARAAGVLRESVLHGPASSGISVQRAPQLTG